MGAIGCTSEEGLTGPDAPAQSLEFENVERSAVDLETIDQGAFGDLEEETLRVIRDQEEFDSFWNSLHGDDAQAPEVDFSDKIVLAAVLGARNTGGYEAKIESITEDTNPQGVNVSVTETEPGSNCAVTQAKTVPYHVVKMEAPSTDRVQFQDIDTRTRDCN